MSRKLKKSILGYVFAPILGLLTIVFLLIVEWVMEVFFNFKTVNPFPETLMGMTMAMGISGVCLIIILIGFSTFYMHSKLNLTKWHNYLYSGLIWGVLLFSTDVLILLRGLPLDMLFFIFLSIEIICVISFISYWLIAVRE